MLDDLAGLDVARGDQLALVVATGVGAAMATAGGSLTLSVDNGDLALLADVVRSVEEALRPRWVMWSNSTAVTLVEADVRVATSWDIAAVHRLLFGGWRAEPGRVWAQLHDLALDAIPTTKPPDLFSETAYEGGPPDEPVRGDGYLRPEWASGEWSKTPERLARWAELAITVAELQQARLAALADRPRAAATARAESAAELLCAELSVDGLPIDRAAAEALIAVVRRCTPALGGRGRGTTRAGATPKCCATRRRVSTATCAAPDR